MGAKVLLIERHMKLGNRSQAPSLTADSDIHGFPGKSYTPHPMASKPWLPYISYITTPEVTR